MLVSEDLLLFDQRSGVFNVSMQREGDQRMTRRTLWGGAGMLAVLAWLAFITTGCSPKVLTNVEFSSTGGGRDQETIPFTGSLAFWTNRCSHHLVTRVICDFCEFSDADRRRMQEGLSRSGRSILSFKDGLRTVNVIVAHLSTYPEEIAGVLVTRQPDGVSTKEQVISRGWYNPVKNDREGNCNVSELSEEGAGAIAVLLGVHDGQGSQMLASITKGKEWRQFTLPQEMSQRFFGGMNEVLGGTRGR